MEYFENTTLILLDMDVKQINIAGFDRLDAYSKTNYVDGEYSNYAVRGHFDKLNADTEVLL